MCTRVHTHMHTYKHMHHKQKRIPSFHSLHLSRAQAQDDTSGKAAARGQIVLQHVHHLGVCNLCVLAVDLRV